MSMHLARPRDEQRLRSNVIASCKHTGPWVVECFDVAGAWEWTHFGEEPMTKRQAKKMAKDLNAITKQKIRWGTFRKAASARGRADT